MADYNKKIIDKQKALVGKKLVSSRTVVDQRNYRTLQEAVTSTVKSNDMARCVDIIDDAVIDLHRTIRDIWEHAGFTQAEMSEILTWPKDQVSMCMRDNPVRIISYDILLEMCDIMNCSLSSLIFNEELPLFIDTRFQMFTEILSSLDVKRVRAVEDYCKANLSATFENLSMPLSFDTPEAKNEYRKELRLKKRDLIENVGYRRLCDYAAMQSEPLRGITCSAALYSLTPMYKALDTRHRFVGRIHSLILLCILTNVSPDYLIRKDYSSLLDVVQTSKGKNVKLRNCDKDVISYLLNADSPKELNKVFATFLAHT